MSDLIDRHALLKQIDIDSGDEPGYYGDTWKFIDTIKSMPSATDTNVGTKPVIYSHKIERAIRGLTEWQKHVQTESDIDRDISVAVEALKAQLGTDLAEVGTDLISRQAAIDALRTCYDTETITMDNGDEYINYGDAVGEIELLPPAQPEIIRCKDCKHWIPYDWMFSEIWQSRNMADYSEDEIGCDCCDMAMKADDFCSRAERRTDG